MTPEEIRTELERIAHEQGFPIFGVSSPTIAEENRQYFHDWLKNGFHGPLGYLQRRRDLDGGMEAVFPGARSVIVVGAPYKKSDQNSRDTTPCGWVSRYARGRDYHKAIEPRLKIMAKSLESHGGRQRCMVDHGPVQERAYAFQAGLGFWGKNSCLIHPVFGSYFFIGIIITTLNLPQDSPQTGTCGECRRCLDACETGALVAPFTVNAAVCLSCITVEKGSRTFPTMRHPWVLGCDACQESCPWNKKAPESNSDIFSEEHIPSRLPLREILEMDSDTFRGRFSGSVAMRPGRKGMIRNAAMAAAHLKESSLLPELERLFKDEEDEITREFLDQAIKMLMMGKNEKGGLK